MKKGTYLIVVSQLAILLLLASKPSSVLAAAAYGAIPDANNTATTASAGLERAQRGPHLAFGWRSPWRNAGHSHVSSQSVHAQRCVDSWNTRSFRGNNLFNDGNRGYNGGFTQDNSSNDGNQLVNQGRLAGNQVHHQRFVGCSFVGNHMSFVGNNMSNSGNQGYNRGFNQDNNSNRGNQIIN